jgi:hypothetical protein
MMIHKIGIVYKKRCFLYLLQKSSNRCNLYPLEKISRVKLKDRKFSIPPYGHECYLSTGVNVYLE